MTTQTKEDVDAALKFLGFDSLEDAHYWATDDNELNRLEALINLLSDHRSSAQTKGSPMSNPIDISSEEYRVYTYRCGASFRIDRPTELHILVDEKGTSHRVIDESGMTHRPERGWTGISWKPREGAPAYVA